jgi:hypothetical protein
MRCRWPPENVVAEWPHLFEPQTLNLIAKKNDRAVGRHKTQQRQTERSLSRTGFADHPKGLALAYFQADAVDRLDVPDDFPQHAALDGKPDFQVGRLQHDGSLRLRRRGIRLRFGGKQGSRIGMRRCGKYLLNVALFDDLAFFHHAHPLCDLAHNTEVVGDEEKRHAEPLLKLLQQFDDLRLHGHIERRGRFVSDQQVRLVGERHGDHDALPLAARKLVRITTKPGLRVRDPHLGQHLKRACPGRGAGHAPVQQ